MGSSNTHSAGLYSQPGRTQGKINMTVLLWVCTAFEKNATQKRYIWADGEKAIEIHFRVLTQHESENIMIQEKFMNGWKDFKWEEHV